VSLDTVEKHVTNVFGKLGVGNRTATVARARKLDPLS
jgi:ATP/maltotriose-dependent transcriptional regulator MalT